MLKSVNFGFNKVLNKSMFVVFWDSFTWSKFVRVKMLSRPNKF